LTIHNLFVGLRPEAPKELLLRLGKDSHIHRGLAAGQDRAQRNHQDLQEIVAFGADRPRIAQLGKTGIKSVHRSLRRIGADPASPNLCSGVPLRDRHHQVMCSPVPLEVNIS
jgi:hypothetical protein